MDPWLAYFVVFAFLFLAVQLTVSSVGGMLSVRRRTATRFAALGAQAAPLEDVDGLRRRVSRFGSLPVVADASIWLRQTGTRLSPAMLGGLFVALWLIFAILAGSLAAAPRLAASGVLAFVVLAGYLRVKRARRIARFGEQLPEIVDVIVRSLRAGHPLPVSLALVAREMPEPAGPEFALVVDEVNYGRSLAEALEGLRDRVGYPELQFFVASVSVAHQTGGNLGEILSRLSRMLRERFRLMRRARALSAEGRFSGIALSALPVLLFGVIQLVSPAYYAEFWASPSATTILTVGLALLLLGNITIYRLVNFKV